MLLHEAVEDEDREDRHDGERHEDRPVGGELSLGAEDLQHQRRVGAGVEEDVGRDEVVPDPHRVEDDGGRGDGLHQREDDLEEDPRGAGAVHDGRLVELPGDGAHVAHGQEDGQCRAVGVEGDHARQAVQQVQRLHDLKQGQQDGLEGHQKPQHQVDEHCVVELVGVERDGVGGHLADDHDQQHRAERQEERVAERQQNRRLLKDLHIVAQVQRGRERRGVVGDLAQRLERADDQEVERIEEDDADGQDEQVGQGEVVPEQLFGLRQLYI